MKTRYVVLFFLSFILFTNISCEGDDDDNSDEQEIVLTEENNLYEGDLYRLYLSESIDSVITQIEITEALLLQDPNNDELVLQLATLNETKNGLEADAEIQDANASILINVPRIPRVPPIPPNPCLSGACIPNLMDFLTISPDVQGVVITFREAWTEELITTVSINQFSPLPEYNNLVSATSVDLQEFTGNVFIEVERTYLNNETFSYSLNGNVY